jgi:hypothetical protein
MAAPPEMIARAAQLALEADGIEMTKTMSYMVGNATLKSLKVLELGEKGFKTLALNYLPRRSPSKYCRRFITFHN